MEVKTPNQQSNGQPAETSKLDEMFFSDSDSDFSLPEIECDLCSKSFSNVKAYEQHVSSKKHHQMLAKKKLRQKSETSKTGYYEELDEEASELECDVCNKTFTSYIPYVSHMKGSVHAKNLKQKKLKETLKDQPEVISGDKVGNEENNEDIFPKPFARCTLCQKVFHDPSAFQQHRKGSIHKKKVMQQKALDSLLKEFKDDPELENGEFFKHCEVCGKSFSGPVPYKIHLSSSVHENQVKRTEAMEKLKDLCTEESTSSKMVCKECKRVFTDPAAFKLHLDNNVHEKQTLKDRMKDFIAVHPEIAAMKSVHSVSSSEDEDESDEGLSSEKCFYYLMCKLCHMSFSGLENAKEHVESKKHMKAKKEKKDMKLLKKKLQENSDKVNAVNGHKDEEMAKIKREGDEVDSVRVSKRKDELLKKKVDTSAQKDDFEFV